MNKNLTRTALIAFVHEFFHEQIDGFLETEEFKAIQNQESWYVVGIFAEYCQSCGFWEI